MRILRLTLKAKPFEVMESGEKFEEFRKPSEWMMSRLKHSDGSLKEYDVVMFTNGYGTNKPRMVAHYINWRIADESFELTYSNGLVVEVEAGDIIITIGEIVSVNNYVAK